MPAVFWLWLQGMLLLFSRWFNLFLFIKCLDRYYKSL